MSDRGFESDERYVLGSIAGLESFRDVLVEFTGELASEADPAVVVLELLDGAIAQLRAIEARL